MRKRRAARLKKNSFTVKEDENGKEYVERAHQEISKNYQGLNIKDKEETAVMAEQSDEQCPVKSSKKYISKLDPECDILFPYVLTHPAPNIGSQTWYTKRPIGVNTIGG